MKLGCTLDFGKQIQIKLLIKIFFDEIPGSDNDPDLLIVRMAFIF